MNTKKDVKNKNIFSFVFLQYFVVKQQIKAKNNKWFLFSAQPVPYILLLFSQKKKNKIKKKNTIKRLNKPSFSIQIKATTVESKTEKEGLTEIIFLIHHH